MAQDTYIEEAEGQEADIVPAKRPVGRPTLYKPEYAEQAYKLCQLGATDIELAKFFNVSLDTIHEWSNVNEEFSESRKVGDRKSTRLNSSH